MMTEVPRPADPEQRLLILAPTPRDVRITCDILQRSGIECLPCADLPGLCRRLGEGAGGALITEEAFAGAGAKELLHFLAEQPPWSDLPIIFLTRRGGDSPLAQRAMESLGNILLLERPTKTSMLVSAARAALRERRRQYQTRSHLKMLREARDAAEEASRAKSEFLANMSHEIRTPMTVFMAAIEHLLQIDRSPERRHLLGMADQSAKRLRGLIDDILDFSRIEARKIELQQEPFDLDGCMRGAVEMFALVAQEKNIRLETDVSADAPRMVIGDPDRLSQVLINLIGNAVKFTRAGEIRVSVQTRGGLLEFAVADTGIGIPEEKRDLIFESFSQADASFTRSFGGTGLGLAISKGLIELMGGEIWVRSEEGQGSVFIFTLPLQSAQKESAVPADAPLGGARKPPAAARILLAEDEPMVREMITMMLAQHGWQAEIADTGREAVEKWESGNFDLIFMDLQMPEMNGLEATRTIRDREGGGEKHTCIIGLTAHARREIRDDCLQAGMDQVLTKPVQMKDLYSAVQACLSD